MHRIDTEHAARDLAAVSLIRACIADDADSGILILAQHGVMDADPEVRAFVLAVASLAGRALVTTNGCRMAWTMKVLDAWTEEFSDQAAYTGPAAADG